MQDVISRPFTQFLGSRPFRNGVAACVVVIPVLPAEPFSLSLPDEQTTPDPADRRHCPVHGEHGLDRDRDLAACDRGRHRHQPADAEARDHLLSLSLAVFIPISGWTADRFGARMVFAPAIAVFMLGSIGCALSSSGTVSSSRASCKVSAAR